MSEYTSYTLLHCWTKFSTSFTIRVGAVYPGVHRRRAWLHKTAGGIKACGLSLRYSCSGPISKNYRDRQKDEKDYNIRGSLTSYLGHPKPSFYCARKLFTILNSLHIENQICYVPQIIKKKFTNGAPSHSFCLSLYLLNQNPGLNLIPALNPTRQGVLSESLQFMQTGSTEKLYFIL